MMKFLTDTTIMLMVQKSGEPVEVGSLCHYLRGFIHPKWLLGISEPSTVSCVKFTGLTHTHRGQPSAGGSELSTANHNSMTLYNCMPIKWEKNYTHWEI